MTIPLTPSKVSPRPSSHEIAKAMSEAGRQSTELAQILSAIVEQLMSISWLELPLAKNASSTL